MNDLLINRATPDDALEIQQATNEASMGMYRLCGWSENEIGSRFTEEKTQEGAKKLSDSIKDFTENDIFLVARKGERIIGYIYAEKQKERIILEAMYILPEFQGKGVSQALWEETLKYIPQETPIYLNVLALNSKAINFYKKIGFVETGRRSRDDRFKASDGSILEEIEMVRA